LRAGDKSTIRKLVLSQVFAGQAVGIKEVHDDIWLVSFMDYDLGNFDPLKLAFPTLTENCSTVQLRFRSQLPVMRRNRTVAPMQFLRSP
jgi:hypothetical protein